MLKHEGILSVIYDFLSFYMYLLVTVITCKICMFKFGILVACDIENILHFKKINEEWLLYKWYRVWLFISCILQCISWHMFVFYKLRHTLLHFYIIFFSTFLFYNLPSIFSFIGMMKIFHPKVKKQNCFLWTDSHQSIVDQTHITDITSRKTVYLLHYLTSPHTRIPYLQFKLEYKAWLRIIITLKYVLNCK